MIIAPYYCVIGGWVAKYLFEYIKGGVDTLADDNYFGEFIGNPVSVEFWFVIFTVVSILIVIAGVVKGVERVSKIMMPLLILLAVAVSVYSITRPGAIEGAAFAYTRFQKLLAYDGRCSNGTDVLFPFNRNGNSLYLRLIPQERCRH